MGRLVVVGGNKLEGSISIDGSKNAVLPILAASILNGRLNIIKNCPKLKDVDTMLEILKRLGCKVKVERGNIIIDSKGINSTYIPEELAAQIRSSIILLGPMLARCKKVAISYPGVCVYL